MILVVNLKAVMMDKFVQKLEVKLVPGVIAVLVKISKLESL